MYKKNKIYILFISLGLVIAVIGYFTKSLWEHTSIFNWTQSGLWISEFAGLIMLLVNGTFIKSKFFLIFKTILGLFFVAALFKIMHWPYANIIAIAAFGGVIIIYLFSFIKKPIKKRLDYLKLIWVSAQYSIGILLFLHLIERDFTILPSVIMWLMIIDYLKMEIERSKRKRIHE